MCLRKCKQKLAEVSVLALNGLAKVKISGLAFSKLTKKLADERLAVPTCYKTHWETDIRF
jgi:hypothetical protein